MAHHIAKQVHDKFKIFSGELATDGTFGKLAEEVATSRKLLQRVLATFAFTPWA